MIFILPYLNSMLSIYILSLENGKYYIGKTRDISSRLNSHFEGNGSAWTKKFKPTMEFTVFDNCDDFDEDKYVKIYMSKYGIENVRGGSYSRVNLTENEKNLLTKEINGCSDKCFICGGKHFAKKCNDKKSSKISENNVLKNYPITPSELKNAISSGELLPIQRILYGNTYNQYSTQEIEEFLEKKLKKACSICGRKTHQYLDCYAKIHVNGQKL